MSSDASLKVIAAQPSVVLLDIEGTIAPISFVHDVLFPYALKALPEVCRTKWQDVDFKEYVKAFPSEAQQSPEALVQHVQDLTARDVKVASLKNLQGYLWKTGYESGAFTTPLFSDVVPFLRDGVSRMPPIKLAIYSSGSVAAQKLFSTYVQNSDGVGTIDLKPLISANFDTVNAGPKMQASSYRSIASELALPARDIHFMTDNIKEAEAAEEAGMTAFLVMRPGNAPLLAEDERTWTDKSRFITSFEQLHYS